MKDYYGILALNAIKLHTKPHPTFIQRWYQRWTRYWRDEQPPERADWKG